MTNNNEQMAALRESVKQVTLHYPMCMTLEHEQDSSLPDDCSCGQEDKLIQLITTTQAVAVKEAEMSALEWARDIQGDAIAAMAIERRIKALEEQAQLTNTKDAV